MEEEKKQKNGKPKGVANGEGSFYFSETLQRWVFQYKPKGEPRQTMKQRKNESERAFRKRVTEVKSKLDNGTYISKSTMTIYSLGLEIIEDKFNRNKINEGSYVAEKQLLDHIKDSFLKESQFIADNGIGAIKQVKGLENGTIYINIESFGFCSLWNNTDDLMTCYY